MKVVINKCYGGFGVSIAAMKEMLGKCKHVVVHEPIEYYGGTGKFYEMHPNHDWRKEQQEDIARHKKYGTAMAYSYFTDEGKPVTDEHSSDAHRACPVLIETVERMGQAANGMHAELAIVEIPDGVEWEISEYDGREHVAEVHRTWA